MGRHILFLIRIQKPVRILHPGLVRVPVSGKPFFQNERFVALQLDLDEIVDLLTERREGLLASLRPEAAALTAVAGQIVFQFIGLHLQVVFHVQIFHALQPVERQIQHLVVLRIIVREILPVHIRQEIQHRLRRGSVQRHLLRTVDPVFR